mmetsp:Transcript_8922/g.29164  ORF Transcript_8922/g.29164 Transcript_8922/m.29164 type:complete len:397 (-) Transcript_8922:195-1385(-)
MRNWTTSFAAFVYLHLLMLQFFRANSPSLRLPTLLSPSTSSRVLSPQPRHARWTPSHPSRHVSPSLPSLLLRTSAQILLSFPFQFQVCSSHLPLDRLLPFPTFQSFYATPLPALETQLVNVETFYFYFLLLPSCARLLVRMRLQKLRQFESCVLLLLESALISLSNLSLAPSPPQTLPSLPPFVSSTTRFAPRSFLPFLSPCLSPLSFVRTFPNSRLFLSRTFLSTVRSPSPSFPPFPTRLRRPARPLLFVSILSPHLSVLSTLLLNRQSLSTFSFSLFATHLFLSIAPSVRSPVARSTPLALSPSPPTVRSFPSKPSLPSSLYRCCRTNSSSLLSWLLKLSLSRPSSSLVLSTARLKYRSFSSSLRSLVLLPPIFLSKRSFLLRWISLSSPRLLT